MKLSIQIGHNINCGWTCPVPLPSLGDGEAAKPGNARYHWLAALVGAISYFHWERQKKRLIDAKSNYRS
jgi:hypothetical protein